MAGQMFDKIVSYNDMQGCVAKLGIDRFCQTINTTERIVKLWLAKKRVPSLTARRLIRLLIVCPEIVMATLPLMLSQQVSK